MAYILKNTAALINTRITDLGRKKLSEGNFNVSYFQIGDSEVCYNCASGTNIKNSMVLAPDFNAQNNTGSPESNKGYVKYPYYVDGLSGNTYGIPTMESVATQIFNTAAPRGFFTGSTGSPISFTAFTSSAYTITPNFYIDFTGASSATTVNLISGTCDPSVTGTPSVNDFVMINFDGNGGCGDIQNYYPMLFYKIQGVTGTTIELDRPLPDYVSQGCLGDGRVLIYPSGMTALYDSNTPEIYWNDDVINFETPCDISQTDVKVWNMNIPWSQSPAGVINTVDEDYSKYGSVDYLGSKEYFGYNSNSGQTFINISGNTGITDTYFYNSYGNKNFVQPREQKAVAIVHYTNQAIDNFYGEKFAFEPFDPLNPGQTGQARNFKVTIPWLMWHKNPNKTIGEEFYVDPAGYNLLQPAYMTSSINQDMNEPGLRYFHLWDTHPNVDGYPNRVGKVFPDTQTIIFDDDEIVAAMSYKSNRNWTLPAPKLGLITPNICEGGAPTQGILTGDTEYLWFTYRFNSTAFTDSLHCNYYSKIQGPTTGCTDESQNVTVRFGDEFPFLTQSCSGFSANEFHILFQKTIGDALPDPSQWSEYDFTSRLTGSSVSGYITASGMTGVTFTIDQDVVTGSTIYTLSDYISIPQNGETDKLNFGDEYFFYGNINADISATIYEMKYAINLSDQQFTSSNNPTIPPPLLLPDNRRYITEIGLYDSNKDLIILSKLQYPILRQGIQQFLVKVDF